MITRCHILLACTLLGAQIAKPQVIHTSSPIPKIGDPIPCHPVDSIVYPIASAQLSGGCEAIYGSITFFLATTDGSTISYISTGDSLFSTPDGVKVGVSYKRVRLLGGSRIIEETGWAYYSRLPSGWCAKYSGFPGGATTDSTYEFAPCDSVVCEVFLR